MCLKLASKRVFFHIMKFQRKRASIIIATLLLLIAIAVSAENAWSSLARSLGRATGTGSCSTRPA
jgi:hypothetical protein